MFHFTTSSFIRLQRLLFKRFRAAQTCTPQQKREEIEFSASEATATAAAALPTSSTSSPSGEIGSDTDSGLQGSDFLCHESGLLKIDKDSMSLKPLAGSFCCHPVFEDHHSEDVTVLQRDPGINLVAVSGTKLSVRVEDDSPIRQRPVPSVSSTRILLNQS